MIGEKRRAGISRPAFVLAACIAVVGAVSCYTTDYRREISANVTLISDLADKLADYSRGGFVIEGRPVTPEEMGEFYYALRKARATGAMTAPGRSSLPSHRDYVRMLDAYAEFVRIADEYRLAGAHDPARLAALLKQRDEVKRIAGEVTIDLARESG